MGRPSQVGRGSNASASEEPTHLPTYLYIDTPSDGVWLKNAQKCSILFQRIERKGSGTKESYSFWTFSESVCPLAIPKKVQQDLVTFEAY